METATLGHALIVSVAFLAGWTNVFLQKHFSCYVSMMTGNTFKLSAKAANLDADGMPLLAITILCFGMGCAGFKYLDLRNKNRSGMVAASFVFALFALVDVLRRGSPQTTSSWSLPLLAAASGVVNSFSSDRAGLTTFVVTGHLMKLSNDFAVFCFGGMGLQQRNDVARSLLVVGSFCAGVVCGTCTFHRGWLELLPFTAIGAAHMLVMVGYEVANGFGGYVWGKTYQFTGVRMSAERIGKPKAKEKAR